MRCMHASDEPYHCIKKDRDSALNRSCRFICIAVNTYTQHWRTAKQLWLGKLGFYRTCAASGGRLAHIRKSGSSHAGQIS